MRRPRFKIKSLIIILSIFLMLFGSLTALASSTADPAEILMVGVPTDRCPVFYLDPDTDEITGIGVDLMRIAAKNAGYNASFKAISEATLKEALDNPEYDVVMPFGSAIRSAAGEESLVTSNLMQTPFTIVTKGKSQIPTLNHLHVGMVRSLSGAGESIKDLYPDIQITFYETMPECVKALRNGEVDALMHNSYVWSYVLQKPTYNDLRVQPTVMFSMDFRAGTLNTPEGKAVIDRLDRGISELSDNQVQAVVMDYTSRHLYREDLWDYLYEHRFLMVALAVFLWISITGIVHRQRAVKKKQEKKIRELVERDPLTGALSLEGFKTRVEELLTEHPENQYLLLFSNIKNFKYINETMSRETGDQILKFWVKIATEYFTDEDAIGRITGDRFAVLRKYTGEDQIRRDMGEVIDPIKSFFIDRGRELTLQVCTGIYALQPEDYHDKDVDRMLDYARMAEKRVRNTQKTGFEFYNSEQWEKGKQIVNISGHLPIALKNEEIQVWYQPQVDYKTGLICGAEALCRWNHDKLGWISPAVFIPTLEETGLIYDLDCYIWDKVCQDLHRWNEQGEHRSVSVNLSRSDIRGDRDIPEYFFDLLKKYDLTPDQLRIEITESAFVENKELLIRTTNELHDCGFQVEMDDFGSGYSSLNMLKEVPVDRIKMDLHFLTDSGDRKKSEIIIEQVIILVEKLGMKLIAEGVENNSQASFLGERGCEEMQGYHFFKPMPVEDFEATWRENHKG